MSFLKSPLKPLRSIRNKFRFNLAVRLSLIFSLVFILVVLLIYLAVVPSLENNLADQKKTELSSYATLYSESFLSALDNGQNVDSVYLTLLTQQAAEKADARILFMSSDGNLLTDSLNGQAYVPSDYTIARTAVQSGVLQTEVSTHADGRAYAMAAVPVFQGNRVVDVIVVSGSMTGVESSVTLVKRLMAVAAAMAVALALIATYVVSNFIARRVRKIEAGAKQIANGDFDTRVPVTSQDELGQLAGAFNDMGDKLGSAFQRIDVEKRRAKLLLDDLSEGVIGIDTGGRVVVANPAAELLLEREIEPPVPLEDCVPPEVCDLWRSMDAAHPQREDTFLFSDDQALSVHSSILSDQGELSSLLVLRDVSQEVKLERSRRDFIANASHELKTPLFSLGGFLEILQDEEVDDETKKEFVATMREQVDRLANLARDLLDLSRMDSGAMSVRSGSVDLKEVIDSVAREFAAQQAGNEAVIDTSLIPAELMASCDRDRTVQLVRILLDNALKYSPPRTTVRISGAGNGDRVSFTVADQGRGIPAEELPRIFERFYRGRTASRVRGTGLGLSIAHEIVRLMNGSIEVKSGNGDGAAFTVTLPKNGNGNRRSAAINTS